MLSTNLISNGDMSHGTQHWSGSNLTVSNGVLTVQGSLAHDQFIPVSSNRKYRLTYDMKVNNIGTSSSPFYSVLFPYDNTRNMIGIHTTNLYNANCNTTLAADLKNGDTTATLTNASNWGTNLTYQRLGICNKLAWGYNRCSNSYSYSSKNGNVITLASAWNAGTIPSGTKVSLFRDGSTYYYPNNISNANLPADWTHYSIEFYGGNTIRYSCQYIKFGTLGYSHNCSFKNICLECISDIQYNEEAENFDFDLSKQGVFTSNLMREDCDKIRYVRDKISGSTANTRNHWCEFQVFNDVDENIAWGRDVKVGTTNYSNSVITDGIVSSPHYIGGNTGDYLLFDIGYLENISKIHVWHYYSDSRTYYNNITEVSRDGVNWRTVYQGEQTETSSGNEIIVHPVPQLFKNGMVYANEFYEF